MIVLFNRIQTILLSTAASAAISGLFGQEADEERAMADAARAYLAELVYSEAEVEDWLSGEAFPFSSYDAELGWLAQPMRRSDGVAGAICSYNYDGPLGARRLINGAGQASRISAYGNSFTQGDQVSDGETWPERLAAHLGEPVRNYGVGGYSVYQAYLRMMRVESELPSEVIILNIFEDDHYRNLDAWRAIRVSKNPLFIEPTLPHLRVDLESGECIEMPNPCPTSDSVRNLSDPDWVYRRFKDDFALGVMLDHHRAEMAPSGETASAVKDRAETIGINTRVDEGAVLLKAAIERHTRAAFLATRYVIEKVEAHARQMGKKTLYVLSFRARTLARCLNDGTRFDQEFIEYLDARDLHYVDLMEAHVKDFQKHAISASEYVELYYIGHYNPKGNFFTANAVKNKLASLLDPPPPAYRFSEKDYWKEN